LHKKETRFPQSIVRGTIFSAGHSGVDFAGAKEAFKMVLNMSLTFLMQ